MPILPSCVFFSVGSTEVLTLLVVVREMVDDASSDSLSYGNWKADWSRVWSSPNCFLQFASREAAPDSRPSRQILVQEERTEKQTKRKTKTWCFLSFSGKCRPYNRCPRMAYQRTRAGLFEDSRVGHLQ